MVCKLKGGVSKRDRESGEEEKEEVVKRRSLASVEHARVEAADWRKNIKHYHDLSSTRTMLPIVPSIMLSAGNQRRRSRRLHSVE